MDIYNILNELNIKYEEVEHIPIYTIEDAIKIGISNMIDGVECKNLFVKSKKNYYLIFTDASKKINLVDLAKSFNEKKFSFASTSELKELLGLEIGSVTPFGIINDFNNKVTLIIDRSLENKRVLVHPNVNNKTLSLDYDDLLRFIEYANHKYYFL